MPRRAKGLTAAQVGKGRSRAGMATAPASISWCVRGTRNSGCSATRGAARCARWAWVRRRAAPRCRSLSAREGAAAARVGARGPRSAGRARGREGQSPADAARAEAAAMTFGDVADMYIAAHEPPGATQASPAMAQHAARLCAARDRRSASRQRRYRRGDEDHRTAVAGEDGDRIACARSDREHPRLCQGARLARRREPGALARPSRPAVPKRSKVQRVEHHAALPWRETGAFMQRLRQNTGLSARCLEFPILTACRSGEVRGARWDEIDLEARGVDNSARTHEGRARASRAARTGDGGVARDGAARHEGFVFPGLKAASTLSDGVTRAVHVAAARRDGARLPFDVPRLVPPRRRATRASGRGGAGACARDKVEAAYHVAISWRSGGG